MVTNIRRQTPACQTQTRISGYSSNSNRGFGSRIFDLPFTGYLRCAPPTFIDESGGINSYPPPHLPPSQRCHHSTSCNVPPKLSLNPPFFPCPLSFSFLGVIKNCKILLGDGNSSESDSLTPLNPLCPTDGDSGDDKSVIISLCASRPVRETVGVAAGEGNVLVRSRSTFPLRWVVYVGGDGEICPLGGYCGVGVGEGMVMGSSVWWWWGVRPIVKGGRSGSFDGEVCGSFFLPRVRFCTGDSIFLLGVFLLLSSLLPVSPIVFVLFPLAVDVKHLNSGSSSRLAVEAIGGDVLRTKTSIAPGFITPFPAFFFGLFFLSSFARSNSSTIPRNLFTTYPLGTHIRWTSSGDHFISFWPVSSPSISSSVSVWDEEEETGCLEGEMTWGRWVVVVVRLKFRDV